MDSVVGLCVGFRGCVVVGQRLPWRHKMRTRHLHFLPHSRFFGSILPSTIILSADNHKQGDWMGGGGGEVTTKKTKMKAMQLAACWRHLEPGDGAARSFIHRH